MALRMHAPWRAKRDASWLNSKEPPGRTSLTTSPEPSRSGRCCFPCDIASTDLFIGCACPSRQQRPSPAARYVPFVTTCRIDESQPCYVATVFGGMYQPQMWEQLANTVIPNAIASVLGNTSDTSSSTKKYVIVPFCSLHGDDQYRLTACTATALSSDAPPLARTATQSPLLFARTASTLTPL